MLSTRQAVLRQFSGKSGQPAPLINRGSEPTDLKLGGAHLAEPAAGHGVRRVPRPRDAGCSLGLRIRPGEVTGCRAAGVHRFVHETPPGLSGTPETHVSSQGRRQDNRPGQATFQRTSEPPETCVALLITQRSRVQIPPPLLGHRPLPIMEGAFCMRFVNGSACRRATNADVRPQSRQRERVQGQHPPSGSRSYHPTRQPCRAPKPGDFDCEHSCLQVETIAVGTSQLRAPYAGSSLAAKAMPAKPGTRTLPWGGSAHQRFPAQASAAGPCQLVPGEENE